MYSFRYFSEYLDILLTQGDLDPEVWSVGTQQRIRRSPQPILGCPGGRLWHGMAILAFGHNVS